jgi:hypothetical protein
MRTFSKGDKVSQQTHGTTTTGVVHKKISTETDEAGRHVMASTDEPQYLVKSDNSGATAVHKPPALITR